MNRKSPKEGITNSEEDERFKVTVTLGGGMGLDWIETETGNRIMIGM